MILYNGMKLPDIGAGTYPFKEELISAIPELAEIGYRLFDTSDNYRNEQYIGEGLSKVSTDILKDITVITKYSNPRKKVSKAFEESSRLLFSKTATPNRKADIYLMHWPYPYLWEERWKEMENLYLAGKCKAIGVCNFNEEKLKKLLSICRVKPTINQFECHPMFQQKEVQDICRQEHIQVISYSPLARINKDLFNNITLNKIAQTHGMKISQVILKWNVSEGRIPIPASKNKIHMKDNYSSFDFVLSDSEKAEIDALERGLRIRFDPDKRFSLLHKICFFAYSIYVNSISKRSEFISRKKTDI
jgi:diketogulonate reductase-like aldo/keto reductase